MRRKEIIFILLLDTAALLLALAAPQLAQLMFAWLPQCWFRAQFGILCPACGATRCVNFFFKGMLWEALCLHPFIFFLILYGIALLLVLNIRAFTGHGRPVVTFMTHPRTIVLLAVLYTLFGITRTILLL